MGAALVRKPGMLSAKIRDGLVRAVRNHRRRRVSARLRIGIEAALENDREFLPGDADQPRVMDRLHAYAYFLEGLLPVLNRPECAAVFRNGVDRAARYLRQIAPVFARSDVYAQLLRARLLIGDCGADAAHEAEQAASFQIQSGDPRLNGGFLFGRKETEPLPFVNPVSTAFCLQALALWQDRTERGTAEGSLQTVRQGVI